MSMNRMPPRGAAATLAAAGAALLLGLAGAAAAQNIAPRARAPVTVNFVTADVEAVTRAFAAMIERPIVVDPRVRGQITVYSEQPQSVREAFQSYLAALRGLGFALVENSGVLKLVPEADAKLQAGTVGVGEVPVKGDTIITQIFQLRYENPNNLVAVLRPLISANNTINANAGSQSLVITDYADNLQRIAKVIAALDQPAHTDVEVVPLQHAVAADLAPLVQRLSEGGIGGMVTSPQSPLAAGGATVIADSRSNALILRAPSAARLAQMKATIAQLDRPTHLVGPGGGMWVVHLKNADAARLATVVRAAFAALGGPGGAAGGAAGAVAAVALAAAPAAPAAAAGGGAAAPAAAAAAPSVGGFIQADPATNSLIITAPEPLYRQVRALIDQLDERRAQVYIESMIVEVSGDNAADFGFQWQGLLGKSGDRYGLVAGTNFSAPGGAGNIVDISTGAVKGSVALGEGLNVGLLKAYNGVTTLAALARALQTQANTNIVSTPNLITLDNEEAKIVVGQNVPFITGQFTNTGAGSSSGAINPFQTIERKDVGITLRIRPQIGENGAVRMTIFQEQSAVLATTAAGTTNAGPSTTKRSIEGTVTVDDGQILVLGGLIQDQVIVNNSKVPLLGDLPLLGTLFRSESRARTRTNLMVFLRPIVMRDADAANRFSVDRYDQIRASQQQTQPPPSAVVPISGPTVLPDSAKGPAPTVPMAPDAAAPGSPGNPTAP
ncbi:MAG: type II secretion system secretin GspD [Burkholderiaceae bacterium]|nr:type II secretion system secretin GspD [Burkholderiaceae bacterium]